MRCWTPWGHLPSGGHTPWAPRPSRASEEGADIVHLAAGDALGSLALQIRGPRSRLSLQGQGGATPPRNLGIAVIRLTPCSSQKPNPKAPHPLPSSTPVPPKICSSGAGEREFSCETQKEVVMASLRQQRCNGRTSGNRRALSKSSGRCSPELLPTAHSKEHLKIHPVAATYCHYLPVAEPASLEEQVAAGHRPDLARFLQPATAPRAA